MLSTIPGSFVDEATKQIRWRRIGKSDRLRQYEADVPDGKMLALVSRDNTSEGLLWHISVTHWDKNDVPDRCPTWDELKHAKYNLVPADVPMVIIFPTKKAPYVNEHPTCLHLWEATANLLYPSIVRDELAQLKIRKEELKEIEKENRK